MPHFDVLMNQPATTTGQAAERIVARKAAPVVRPFCGLIDAVLVEEPVPFSFAGSISREAAAAWWTWVVRDLAPDLISAEEVQAGGFPAARLEPLCPEILSRAKLTLEEIATDTDALRRLRAQVGRERLREELPVLLSALRARALLSKAQGFGLAANTIAEDAALGSALQSMPLQDPKLASLLFHAALGQVTNPTRLITVVIRQVGGATEAAIARGGFEPLVEAYLAHAQNQIHALQLTGPFADIDLVCRSLERFHKLMRALTGYIEFSRGSRATQALSGITKMVSDRVEPRLKEVVTDLNQALRRPREGVSRIDDDRVLAAMNGIYLLSTVRDCRDSLALNAVFEQVWSQTGQALEMHIQHTLEQWRRSPGDATTGARLDAGIKMAEIRFNPEYADTLRRARVAAERRG